MTHRTDPIDQCRTTPDSALRVIELACRAPSMHNSQPWAWRVRGTSCTLHADWSRSPAATDPVGRNLMIGCGAALHHAEVAARGLGWECHTSRLLADQGPHPDLLATIDLTEKVPASAGHGPGPSPEAVADLHDLTLRRTDRRRFTSWPVPPSLLQKLCSAASARGAFAVALNGAVDHVRLENLASSAHRTQLADPGLSDERRRLLEDSHIELEAGDGLLVLCTENDDPAAWLAAGESLSALWLDAVRRGLSVVPLSPVIEVDESRAALRSDLLGGLAFPQVLLRVSWRPIAAHHLARSTRRPLGEVLLDP